MNNPLTVSTITCPEWTLEEIVQQCAHNGLRGIDFRGIRETLDHSLLPAFTSDTDATLKLLKANDLSIPCMCSSVLLMQPDEAKWKTSIEEFGRYLPLADRFESPFIRIFPGKTPATMAREDAITMARRHARQLAKLASDFNAIPLLETHDDWGAAAEVLKLLEDVPSANFGVIWDVRHTWAAGESPEQAIATLGDRLRHVHVKDSRMIDGKEHPALLGEGVVSVGPALQALKAASYAGWICLETERRWRPQYAPDPEASLPQFASFVRGI